MLIIPGYMDSGFTFICPGVDFFRCENVTSALPVISRLLFRWLMQRKLTAPLMEYLANRVAWDAEMVCSQRLTACPYFKDSEKQRYQSGSPEQSFFRLNVIRKHG
jgi:hypothetical protein